MNYVQRVQERTRKNAPPLTISMQLPYSYHLYIEPTIEYINVDLNLNS